MSALHRRARGLVSVAFAGAGLFVLLAACADSEAGSEPVDTDAASPNDGDEASIDAAASEVSTEASAPEPSPPLQTCNATKPCPVAVAAPIPETRNLVAISGSAKNDVWAVGSSSTILHFDGNEWATPTDWVGDGMGQNTLRGIWLNAPGDVWFLEGTDLVHSSGWQGASATRFERAHAGLKNAMDLGGYPGAGAWNLARGENGAANVLVHWSPWTTGGVGAVAAPILDYGVEELRAVSAADANTIWSVGEGGKVFRLWRTLPEGGAEPAPNEGWRVEEWNSHSKTLLSDVSARDGEVWIVGASGLVRRKGVDADRTERFLPVDTGSRADLHGVHVFAPNDIWIVGDRATILHFDGTSWWRVPTPFEGDENKPALYGLWGADSSELWFVGRGVTLRLNRNKEAP